MNKKQSWMYTSIGAIAISLLSLFLPIISYRSAATGIAGHYNIIKLFSNNELINNVFEEYEGYFLVNLSYSAVSVLTVLLCLLGIGAIILAFVGIKSMNKQYESEKPFRLAMCGLIGTAIPSVVLFILYLFSFNHFLGTMHLGAYIIVTPIAMVLACLTVTSKHRLSRAEAAMLKEATQYIRPAGDLPVIKLGEEQ